MSYWKQQFKQDSIPIKIILSRRKEGPINPCKKCTDMHSLFKINETIQKENEQLRQLLASWMQSQKEIKPDVLPA